MGRLDPKETAIADELLIANLEIRPEGFEVLIDGARISLTVREFQLFSALVSRPNRVMQRPELYTLVWGGAMRQRDRSVDVLVRKIRDKLERSAPGWRYIHTHFGVGYRFQPERLELAQPDETHDSEPADRSSPPLAELSTG